MSHGTVLILRRQPRTSDGDPAGRPVDTELGGWEIAPAGSTEQDDGTRDTTSTRLQAFGGPPRIDIGPGDRVFLAADPRIDDSGRALDAPWRVVGTPEDWGGPAWGGPDRGGGHVVTLERHRG